MIHESFISNEAYVLVWEVTESLDELSALLTNFDNYATEYENLKTDKRRLEFLSVRVAMNYLLNKELEIKYNSEGKPFLSDQSYAISISHSGKWIAVMAHPRLKAGIDIECPTDKIKKLYKRFLSETEQNELFADQNIKKLQIAWSAKEALYKIIGNEAVDFVNQIRIFPFEIEGNGQIMSKHIPSQTVYYLNYKITDQYDLVFCIA